MAIIQLSVRPASGGIAFRPGDTAHATSAGRVKPAEGTAQRLGLDAAEHGAGCDGLTYGPVATRLTRARTMTLSAAHLPAKRR